MSSMAHGRMGNAPNGRGGGTQGPVLVVTGGARLVVW